MIKVGIGLLEDVVCSLIQLGQVIYCCTYSLFYLTKVDSSLVSRMPITRNDCRSFEARHSAFFL